MRRLRYCVIVSACITGLVILGLSWYTSHYLRRFLSWAHVIDVINWVPRLAWVIFVACVILCSMGLLHLSRKYHPLRKERIALWVIAGYVAGLFLSLPILFLLPVHGLGDMIEAFVILPFDVPVVIVRWLLSVKNLKELYMYSERYRAFGMAGFEFVLWWVIPMYLASLALRWQAQHRYPVGHCDRCGYDLRGSPGLPGVRRTSRPICDRPGACSKVLMFGNGQRPRVAKMDCCMTGDALNPQRGSTRRCSAPKGQHQTSPGQGIASSGSVAAALGTVFIRCGSPERAKQIAAKSHDECVRRVGRVRQVGWGVAYVTCFGDDG